MTCSRRQAVELLTCAILIGAVRHHGVDASQELVIHKAGTDLYHRPTCPVVKDNAAGALALSRAQAEARGYKPHPECDPANPKAVTPGPGQTAAPAPVAVYVDGPKYYHRKTCAKLDLKAVKSLTLEAAARTHWPCPACKAPVFKRGTEPAVPGTNRRRGG